MRRATQTVLLMLSLTVAASAFAANGRQKPSEYQEITDEDRAAARERSRNRVSTWSEANMPEEYEFPWMRIGFVALAFAIATPFAIAAYRNSSQELKEHTAFSQQSRKRKPAATDEA